MEKKVIYLLIGVLLFAANLKAQTQESDRKTIVGAYTIKNQTDTMKVWIDNHGKNKIAYFEYLGTCKINTLEFLAQIAIGAKKDKIAELISTLTYIRDKAKEWNSILESRHIDTYSKEFKEADFPRLDMYAVVNNQKHLLWNNKHYITNASFEKNIGEENYKILLNVCGTQVIDQTNATTLHVNNNIELNAEDLSKLILLLQDAGKLSEETIDIDSLLTD